VSYLDSIRLRDDASTLYRAARILERHTGITPAVRTIREQAAILRRQAEKLNSARENT